MLGKLVEIGVPEVLEHDGQSKEESPDIEAIKANGARGRVVQEITRSTYLVDTFDGLRLTVSEEHLKDYDPDAPEDGGFDLAWPHGAEGSAHFAASVIEMLRDKDYCVVQMFMSKESRDSALREASPNNFKFSCMMKEFENAYLGRQHKCKTSWLKDVTDMEHEDDLETVLDHCDQSFSNLTRLMLHLAPFALDFTPYSRTTAMIRMPLQSAQEEAKLEAKELTEDDIEDGLVDSHIEFLKRRKLCMMFIVETGGGELTFIPKDSTKERIVLGTTKGRLVIFRHDRMSYMYNPHDTTDLVLQAWVMSPPDQIEFKSLEGDQRSKDDARGLLLGPHSPNGEQLDVAALSTGFPAGGHVSDESFWVAVMAGTDGALKVPITRFDIDVYTRPPSEWTPGFSYTIHGGLTMDNVYAIDNKFWGITEQDAFIMAPAQKQVLEKAYDALFRSGYTKPTVKGQKIGLFLGHSGDDWGTWTCGGSDAHIRAFESRAWAAITGRIAYALGIKGPQSLVDTACSSALVAYGVGHTALRTKEPQQYLSGISTGMSEALMLGCNMIIGPGGHVGLSGPHMLTSMGRCFTFDQSADGFERGEGTGALLIRRESMRGPDALASVIGACLNQDGKSASMTAPNGPSQQACIRASMREAGISANQVTCAELHGTGTALGDPIEVGALRGVMEDRQSPLLQTTAKSHIGHLEASAGSAGLTKCIIMCRSAAGSPNCHILVLNPHLDVNGYPTYFDTELVDYGANSGYSGVSSFGFGGANARADVFATAHIGPHRVGELDAEKIDYITVMCPFDQGPMHYLDGKAVPLASSKKYKKGRYHADSIRDEFDSYECSTTVYTGQYQLTPTEEDKFDEQPSDPIYIVGTWDAWREPREMETGDSDGEYTFLVTLGETRWEQFQLRVNKDPSQAIFPVVKNGSMHARVVGPDDGGEGLFWLLDGRDTATPVGTVFQISFQWGDVLSVKWHRVELPPPTWIHRIKHSYSIMGTWTAWMYREMRNVSTEECSNTWETSTRIGMSGVERFRFLRDRDLNQVIYPAKNNAMDTTVPACGPDDLSNEKSWSIRGRPGETAMIRLQVVDAHVIMTTYTSSVGAHTVESVEGPMRHSYHVTGSFNHWRVDELVADEESPGVFKCTGTVGETCEECFKIMVDADPGLTFFPEVPDSHPGSSIVFGPEKASNTSLWCITSLKAGAMFEIVLNRNAIDKRRIVDINWITDCFDFDSMKATAFNYVSTLPEDALL